MASLWQKSACLLQAPVNELAFAVRSRLRWRRGRPAPSATAGDGLFAWLSGPARMAAMAVAADLTARHDLARLRGAAAMSTYSENLALLERLEALGDAGGPPPGHDVLRALDVGCGSFHYATALQRWLARAGAAVELRGIEIDGYGIYADGHSRADHAHAHAELAGPGVTFEVADFPRLVLPAQDVVTMLFPFLHAFTLLRWGSPLSHLRPRRLLRSAVASLRPHGRLVVVNQTAAEFARLQALLAGQPVELLAAAPFATDLVPYAERTAGRIGSLWRRIGLPESGPRR